GPVRGLAEPVLQVNRDVQGSHPRAGPAEDRVGLDHRGGGPQGQDVADIDVDVEPLLDDRQHREAQLQVEVADVGQPQRHGAVRGEAVANVVAAPGADGVAGAQGGGVVG